MNEWVNAGVCLYVQLKIVSVSGEMQWLVTSSASSWLGVGRNDSWVSQAPEIQAIFMVEILIQSEKS